MPDHIDLQKKMKSHDYVILITIIILSLLGSLLGINWGLPTNYRVDLIMSENLKNKTFYDLMIQTRKEIYGFSDESPIGRIKESPIPMLSPVLKTLGVTGNENLYFRGEKKILANFVRPYFLRTNHPDEQMTIASLSVMHPKQLDFNPRVFQYGGVYIYGMAAWLGLNHILGIIKLVPDLNFYFQTPEAIGKIFMLGRILNPFFFALTAIVIFIIAKKVYSIRAGILSAVFFVVCPAFVFQSHIMKPYTIATFFAMLCIYYSLIVMSDSITKNYILLGLFTGLTIGTMPVYCPIIIAPLIAHFLISKQFNKKLFYLCLTGFVIFFITNPYWFIKFKTAYWELSGTRGMYARTFSISYLIRFFTEQLPIGLPHGLLFVCFIGIIYAIWRREKSDILFLTIIVIPLLFFGWLLQNQQLSIHTTRFLLPWISIMLVLGARFLDILLNKTSVKLLTLLFLVIILTHTAMNSVIFVQNFILDGSANSTRLLAGKWINEKIPAKSNIGMLLLPGPAHTPPFDFSRYGIAVLRNEFEKILPDYFVTVNIISYDNINYQLIKSFEPINSIGIFKYNTGIIGINSLVNIYKRKN